MKSLREIGFSSYSVTSSGEVYSHLSERFLKLQDRGYVQVGLLGDDGIKKNVYVHRLVALVFCDGFSEDKHVNHIDGDKSNNNAWNLEWVTRSENMIHAWQNDLIGVDKASVELVHSICRKLEQGFKATDVSTSLGTNINLVQDILQKKSWVWISDDYNFELVPRKGRISPEKALKICKALENKIPMQEIAKMFNTSFYNVKNIKSRRTFTSISKGFKW